MRASFIIHALAPHFYDSELIILKYSPKGEGVNPIPDNYIKLLFGYKSHDQMLNLLLDDEQVREEIQDQIKENGPDIIISSFYDNKIKVEAKEHPQLSEGSESGTGMHKNVRTLSAEPTYKIPAEADFRKKSIIKRDFFQAIDHNDIDRIRDLLSLYPDLIHIEDAGGVRAATLAFALGNYDVGRYLLSQGGRLNQVERGEQQEIRIFFPRINDLHNDLIWNEKSDFLGSLQSYTISHY